VKHIKTRRKEKGKGNMMMRRIQHKERKGEEYFIKSISKYDWMNLDTSFDH
jgi:hypothetical protein